MEYSCAVERRVALQTASSSRHSLRVADAGKSEYTTRSSAISTHSLTQFWFQKTPGLKKKVGRPASHTTRPIVCYLLLPKCKSLCSMISLQMFSRCIWAEPSRASLNWPLAPVLPHPTFVTKQLMMFKRAGWFANYECCQAQTADTAQKRDSCENLVRDLGQGVTPWCNRVWKRPQSAEMREAKWSTRCFHVIWSLRKYRWDKVIYSPFPPAGRASFGLKLGKLVLRDITSKLQMPDVDVKHPQKQRKWFPQTQFLEWSGEAFFLLRDRSTRVCWWIMLCLYAGVSLFTGDRVFAW